jgi:hypothetical protein
VMQKLCAQHPVLFAFFAAKACELPRVDHQHAAGLLAISRELHVGLLRHMNLCCFTLLILNYIERDGRQSIVLFNRALAR